MWRQSTTTGREAPSSVSAVSAAVGAITLRACWTMAALFTSAVTRMSAAQGPSCIATGLPAGRTLQRQRDGSFRLRFRDSDSAAGIPGAPRWSSEMFHQGTVDEDVSAAHLSQEDSLRRGIEKPRVVPWPVPPEPEYGAREVMPDQKVPAALECQEQTAPTEECHAYGDALYDEVAL